MPPTETTVHARRFRWVREDRPGPRWRALLEAAWPDYRRWYLGQGRARRPGLRECRDALAEHVPELVPTWERLVELADGDPLVARMLSLWCPPAYAAGCSQAAWTGGSPALVRNYDYHPDLCEALFLTSSWTGTPVLAASDCLWGALDGVNGHGLAVSLAHGGTRRVARGFGIPLLLRLVLETCATTEAAVAALERVPSHMAYNVTVLDATGAHAVVRVEPGGGARVRPGPVATNHDPGLRRGPGSDPTRSVARARHLLGVHADARDLDELVHRFLEPPLYRTDWPRAFGTLYTAAYLPREARAVYLWPGARVERGLFDADERTLDVVWES